MCSGRARMTPWQDAQSYMSHVCVVTREVTSPEKACRLRKLSCPHARRECLSLCCIVSCAARCCVVGVTASYQPNPYACGVFLLYAVVSTLLYGWAYLQLSYEHPAPPSPSHINNVRSSSTRFLLKPSPCIYTRKALAHVGVEKVRALFYSAQLADPISRGT